MHCFFTTQNMEVKSLCAIIWHFHKLLSLCLKRQIFSEKVRDLSYYHLIWNGLMEKNQGLGKSGQTALSKCIMNIQNQFFLQNIPTHTKVWLRSRKNRQGCQNRIGSDIRL